MEGRIGLAAIMVYACTVDIDSFVVEDLDTQTATHLWLGDSMLEGWGVHSSSDDSTLFNLVKEASVYSWKGMGRSSMTIKDVQSFMTTITAVQPEVVVVALGTNDYLAAKSNATIQADYLATINQIAAIPTVKKIYLLTIPPLTSYNTTVLNSYIATLDYTVIDVNPNMAATATSWISLLSSDNIHPNIYANYLNFQTLAQAAPELLNPQ